MDLLLPLRRQPYKVGVNAWYTRTAARLVAKIVRREGRSGECRVDPGCLSSRSARGLATQRPMEK